MKNNKIIKIFLYVLIIASTLIFTILYYNLAFKCINRYFFKGLIFFIPILFFIILTYLFSKEKINKNVTILLTIIIILISIFGGTIILTKIMVEDLTSEVIDIGEYERILSLENYEKILYQFPKKIPSNVQNARYFYRPQFLQGGMRMELTLEIDENMINSYINKYKYKKIINLQDSNSYNQLKDIGIFDLGNNTYENIKNENATVYIIDSKPYKDNDWNHGYAIFIAVNNQKNKILFQSELW